MIVNCYLDRRLFKLRIILRYLFLNMQLALNENGALGCLRCLLFARLYKRYKSPMIYVIVYLLWPSGSKDTILLTSYE